jgi:hypothetical protein
MILEKEKVNLLSKMEQYMKANGKMIFITVSENYKDLMALFILENSKMI